MWRSVVAKLGQMRGREVSLSPFLTRGALSQHLKRLEALAPAAQGQGRLLCSGAGSEASTRLNKYNVFMQRAPGYKDY